MASLTRTEARLRSDLLTVDRMEVDLDLDQGPDRFGSRTSIRFRCAPPGASTSLGARPVDPRSLMLNGTPVDPAGLADGRIELTGLEAENEPVPEAVMADSRDGQGLHRAVDPADGEHYVYGH